MCDRGEDHKATPNPQERLSLLRRAIFAYTTTFACFGLVWLVLLIQPTSSLGERIVGASMSYAELMAMLYLGASVIDRTSLIDKIGSRFWGPPPPPDQIDERGEK